MAMRRIFWGFCRNWYLMSPLHYLSSCSDFGFEFAEIFVLKKRLPAITETGSRWLRVSVKLGVANSPHHWYTESPTLRITDTRSRRLPAPVIWWVADSPYRWVGESLFKEKISLVSIFTYHRYWESTTPRLGDTGSLYSKKQLVWCRFSELLTATPCL